MKKEVISNYDQLPLTMNADHLANALGISRAGAYELIHTKGFPVIKLGKRLLIPKDKFIEWFEQQISE